MMQRRFLEMPGFYTDMRRVGRRRQLQPVLLCSRHMRELRCVPFTEVLPLIVRAPAMVSPNLQDFCVANQNLFRRLRKNDGEAFGIADLRQIEQLSPPDLVHAIKAEPDHPFSPLLNTIGVIPPIIISGPDTDDRLQKGARWHGRLLIVGEHIYAPTVPPTLAVSLDDQRRRLFVTISCPPANSPSLRIPTFHMPLSTDQEMLREMAARLGVELRIEAPKLETSAFVEEVSWLLPTLSGLYRYIVRKGTNAWPGDLSIALLAEADRQLATVELGSPPLEWLGKFLETPSNEFGQLAAYVAGLQRLLIARYGTLGEELPPMPSDVILDFVL